MSSDDRTLRSELTHDGYSKEEKYFYDLNRELIEKRREELDPKRAQRAESEQSREHWMKCPKCGTQMKTRNMMQILIEECPSCHGVYMDHAELETLLKTRDSGTFLSKLKKAFSIREGEPGMF